MTPIRWGVTPRPSSLGLSTHRVSEEGRGEGVLCNLNPRQNVAFARCHWQEQSAHASKIRPRAIDDSPLLTPNRNFKTNTQSLTLVGFFFFCDLSVACRNMVATPNIPPPKATPVLLRKHGLIKTSNFGGHQRCGYFVIFLLVT